MKNLFALILSLCLVLPLAACGAPSTATSSDSAEASSVDNTSKPISVGFAQVGHESDWRMASTKSAQAVFSAENGYDLKFVDCNQDPSIQMEAVHSFVQQQVDYIVIDPILATGWDEALTECEEAGIPVIVIDRTIDDSDKYVCWVGSNFQTEGLACGEWLKAYTDAKGIAQVNALIIEGTTGASAQLGRSQGFEQIADQYGWNIVAAQSGRFTQVGGQEVMGALCKSYEGQFNVVICQNDNEAFGAMTAMDTVGLSYGVEGEILLLSFDACTAGLEEVKAGNILADFECNPLAASFVEQVIQQLQNGETPEKQLFMEEHWYAHDDTVSSFAINGQEQTVTVVDDAIIEAQY